MEVLACDSFETSCVPARIPEARIRTARSAENLPECAGSGGVGGGGITAEQRASSFSTVPNYDNDEEAWALDEMDELQVGLEGGGAAGASDTVSQFSMDSLTSLESKEPVFIAAGDIRWGSLGGGTHTHTHTDARARIAFSLFLAVCLAVLHSLAHTVSFFLSLSPFHSVIHSLLSFSLSLLLSLPAHGSARSSSVCVWKSHDRPVF